MGRKQMQRSGGPATPLGGQEGMSINMMPARRNARATFAFRQADITRDGFGPKRRAPNDKAGASLRRA